MPTRERSIRVEAVVLSHSDWGEADRLLWLYTREQGKLRTVAKGARKARSRKAGHLEPFTRVSLQLAKGREWWIITQAETIDPYLHLREDLLRVGFASYIVELLDRFTYEEGENSGLYRLLVETLARLDGAEDPSLAIRYYEIRLLDLLGFRPMLFECAMCGAEIQAEDQFFSPAQGGVLCPTCGKSPQGSLNAIPISLTALKYLRHLQRSRYTEARQAHISTMVDREMENVMQQYLIYLLERNLNSPSFVRRVRRDALTPEVEQADNIKK